MVGDDFDELLLVQTPTRLDEPRRGEMLRLPVLLREHLVGHPLHEILQEAILAPLRGEGIGLKGKHFLPDERREKDLDFLVRLARERNESRDRERLAQDGRVLDQASLFGHQPVEPGGDQRVQGFRHLERIDVAGGPVRTSLLHEKPAIQQHPNRLDGI